MSGNNPFKAELSARAWNRIICAVNNRQSGEEAGLQTEAELEHYRRIWSEAEALLEKYGSWPVFDLVELE